MVNLTKIKSKIPRFLRNKYVLTLLFFVIWITIFDKNSVIDWVQNKTKINKIKAEQQWYQEQLDTTLSNIKQLSTSNDSLEKFAREKYRFHKDDEDVFIVEE
jgi:cell division protein FtsB